jgi:hypothetical protein
MLPTALSEVLGMSLSEVMEHYFDGLGEDERVRRIEDAIERKRSDEETRSRVLSNKEEFCRVCSVSMSARVVTGCK